MYPMSNILAGNDIIHWGSVPNYSNFFWEFLTLGILFQDSDGAGGCPFCRAEIKGTESIVVDPFSPDHAVNRTADSSVGNLIDCDIEESGNLTGNPTATDDQATMEVHWWT